MAVSKEWAILIGALKSQIQHLTVEQACAPTNKPSKCRAGQQINRPMDQSFHDYLLPILLQGGWDELQSLNIGGVRHWPCCSDSDDYSMESAIANAVGPDVEVSITRESDRPAWLWSCLFFEISLSFRYNAQEDTSEFDARCEPRCDVCRRL